MKKLRIVQIGASGHYAYALPTIKKYNLDFLAIAPGDESEDISSAIKEIQRYGANPVARENWKDMLDEFEPDIVIINSYMGYNAKMCSYAMTCGCNVFCEKPVATTLDSLSALELQYSRSKVCLSGMFGISYLPHFETARRLIASRAVGDIRLVTAQKSYRLGKRDSFYSSRELYGGTIPWVAIHAIDWIYSICNPEFKGVTAYHSTVGNRDNGELEATSMMLFECGAGVMASVNADYLRPKAAPTHDDDRIRIAGTEGVLEVMGGKVSLITPDNEFKSISLVNPAHELFEEFAMEISGEGKCRVTAKETFDVTRIALLARESADLGKKMEIKL